MTRADVVVAGAGIVGASCAWMLARAGMRVCVVDPRGAAGGATGAGMGHVVMMDDPPAEAALVRRSMELWDEVAPLVPPEAGWRRIGTLWVASDDEELEEARRRAKRLRGAGVGADVIDSARMSELEPNLRRGLAGALMVPGDSVVLPPVVANWMLGNSGVSLMAGRTVTAIRSREVELDGGEKITADAVVNAAGMWGRDLTPGLPLVAKKGHLVVLGGAAELCRHQIVELGYIKKAHEGAAESVSFNVQPRGSEIVVGSSRQVGVEAVGVEPRIRDEMMRQAASFMPALSGLKMSREWTGVRAGSADGLPIIGEHPFLRGVYLAGGHEGLGLTMAMGTAELITNAVLGREQKIDPLPYSPGRFTGMFLAEVMR